MNKTILTRTFVKGIRLVFIATLVLVLALALAVPFGETTTVSATNGTVYFVNAATGDNTWTPEDAQSPDTPWKTISHAVGQCTGNETIVVAAGVYDTTLGEDFPITIGTDLTLEGEGAGITAIDASGSGARVFTINADTVVTISSVTVTGGVTTNGGAGTTGNPGSDGGDGGGIFNSGTLTLSDVIVSSNSTGNGGIGGSNPSADGGNGGSGGGIYNAGVLSLINSTVSGNSTGNGGQGGISYPGDGGYGGDGGSGGGIYNGLVLSLTNSTVSGNSTGNGGVGGGGNMGGSSGGDGGDGGSGGGIYNGLVLSLTNSTLSGNSTGNGGTGGGGSLGGNGGDGGDGGSGGGIYNGLVLSLTNSTISGSSTGDGGIGGSYPSVGDDGDGGSGGGIYNDDGLVEFKGTIIAGNTAAASGPDCYGSFTSFGCNLVQYITGCTIEGDTTGNMTGKDPKLEPLADNGGSTETHALQTGSPAIDAVIDCECTTVEGGPVNKDQREEPRPMDGDDNGSYLCDIGAYEALGPTPLSLYKQGYQAGYKAGLETCAKEIIAVGGIVEPVDRINILTPWLGLAAFIVLAAAIVVLIKRRGVAQISR